MQVDQETYTFCHATEIGPTRCKITGKNGIAMTV